jgi:tetraacyldisaccharide 4'-kinase
MIKDQEGGHIVDTYFIADHVDYHFSQLTAFAKKCKDKGAEWLICTEKDRVKLAESLDLPLPVAWVKIRLVVIEGEIQWRAFVERIKVTLDKCL